MTMSEYVNEWLTAMRPNLARTTYQTYKSANRRFVEYLDIHYPGITLGELRHNHVQEFLNHKLDESCKSSAVKQYYLAIHSGLAYAVKMEYIYNSSDECCNYNTENYKPHYACLSCHIYHLKKIRLVFLQ